MHKSYTLNSGTILKQQINRLVGKFVKQQKKGEWTVMAAESVSKKKRERRQERIGSEIHRLIQQSFVDQRMGLPLVDLNHLTRPVWEITSVNVAKSLETASVGYIVHLDSGVSKEEVETELNEMKGSFKSIIANYLNLRNVPELKFRYDKNEHARMFARDLVMDDPLNDKQRQQ